MLRMPTAEEAIKAIALHVGIDRDAGLLDVFRAIDKGASSRVAALEQRIADAIEILDQAGDNRDAALAKLQEVKA